MQALWERIADPSNEMSSLTSSQGGLGDPRHNRHTEMNHQLLRKTEEDTFTGCTGMICVFTEQNHLY